MSGRQSRRRAASRAAFLVAVLLLVLTSIGIVAFSPWMLRLASDDTLDWTRLSDIGQTYGAISAVVAAVALLGVVTSLVIQRKEAKAARINAQRDRHVELMRMAMEEPRYMECLGPYLTESFAAESQFTYVNLLIAQLHAQFELGDLDEGRLAANAAALFAGRPGRRYWQASATFWRENYPGRKARRFHHVLEEAYRRAGAQPPAVPPASTTRSAASPIKTADSHDRSQWPALVAAAGFGAFAALWLRRPRRTRGRQRSHRQINP
jgi:hypothetical protein